MKEFVIGFRLNHPNIVRYIDFVNVAGLCNCILMEYVVGTSLDEYLATSPDVATKRSVVLQVADALKAIHAEQIIHRDLKPDNIMVTTNGNRVKIVDFGLSDSDNYAISSVILMHEFERYFKDRMDGPLYLCIVSPLYHEPLVANVAEKVAAGLVKRSGRGI